MFIVGPKCLWSFSPIALQELFTKKREKALQ
jgi:hypothetical protein